MSFFSHTKTLAAKNILIIVLRRPFSTFFRAVALPIAFLIFLGYAQEFFVTPSHFGIALPSPLLSLSDALAAAGGHDRLVLINSGFTDGDIAHVIRSIADPLQAAGRKVQVVSDQEAFLATCRETVSQPNDCYAGAVFHSSPTEGDYGVWNYSLVLDAALGLKVDVYSPRNDVEIFPLPLQHAIDLAIASLESSVDQAALSKHVLQFPYTDSTEKDREDQVRSRYVANVHQNLAVAFFLSQVGIIYHLVGFVAFEREIGMSQLIECMMPASGQWRGKFARLLSFHLTFDLIYVLSWLALGLVLRYFLILHTSVWVPLIYYVLSGCALTSFSLCIAVFFRKSQLSGICAAVLSLVLAIMAEVLGNTGNIPITVLAILFPPINIVAFTQLISQWELDQSATDLFKKPPSGRSPIPAFWLCLALLLQLLIYFILAAVIEVQLYGLASKSRTATAADVDTDEAVEVKHLWKIFRHNWWFRFIAWMTRRPIESVSAVKDLSLAVRKGQLMVLLGANGSGKSTTMDCITGTSKRSSGVVRINDAGALGFCPQKNVLWDMLTVEEHIRIFVTLKAKDKAEPAQQVEELIHMCDLDDKHGAKVKTLSGGQKRKLQLALAFAGGSRICCIDEVSSGLDPISRKRIWNILLNERGRRTFILTTHFLDEADVLGDHIVILDNGSLCAEGSAVQLKHQYGGGYRVHVRRPAGATAGVPLLSSFPHRLEQYEDIYLLEDSSLVPALLQELKRQHLDDYRVAFPTIEDVFFRLAEASQPLPDANDSEEWSQARTEASTMTLLPGKHINLPFMTWILFRKRLTILQRQFVPYIAVMAIPLLVGGLATTFLQNYAGADCLAPAAIINTGYPTLAAFSSPDIVLGPSQRFLSEGGLAQLNSLAPQLSQNMNQSSLRLVDTLDQFTEEIARNYSVLRPGGIFLGDEHDQQHPHVFAYLATNSTLEAVLVQNLFDVMITNISIHTQLATYQPQSQGSLGNSFQFIIYFGVAMAVYPAFFALYPTIERLQNIRALHYSSGVRPWSLWLAHAGFDLVFILVLSATLTGVLATAATTWYHLGYLFVAFVLYGLASALLSYLVSLVAASALAAFAIAAGAQAVLFLVYLVVYLVVLTFSSSDKAKSTINLVHFLVAAVAPVPNFARSLLVSLNFVDLACQGSGTLIAYPGQILAYGGPILYLSVQILLYGGILVWTASSTAFTHLLPRYITRAAEGNEGMELVDQETAEGARRVVGGHGGGRAFPSFNNNNDTDSEEDDGLRVLHASKAFGRTLVVEDISFSVSRGEIFALLGPNGAGKTTTISLIRGDTLPAPDRTTEILIEGVSVVSDRTHARQSLGVCPQFDAIDNLTVSEHLTLYARLRGVAKRDLQQNLQQVLRTIGLEEFANRMAADLSGGNKRKLSLGIALIGGPTVVLLDEPSSGMDVVSKRAMWRTLRDVSQGRSIVLTTHSMEEADALANRLGIMATKMLAQGTVDDLRRRYSNALHVHLVTRTAPHSSDEEMARLREWVRVNFPGAQVEPRSYHGQVRLSIPVGVPKVGAEAGAVAGARTNITGAVAATQEEQEGEAISAIVDLLEANRDLLNLANYSVSPTSMDHIFLSVLSRHNNDNVGEPAHHPENGMLRSRRRKMVGRIWR